MFVGDSIAGVLDTTFIKNNTTSYHYSGVDLSLGKIRHTGK